MLMMRAKATIMDVGLSSQAVVPAPVVVLVDEMMLGLCAQDEPSSNNPLVLVRSGIGAHTTARRRRRGDGSMASTNLWSSLNSSANSVYKLAAEKINSGQLGGGAAGFAARVKKPTSPPPPDDPAGATRGSSTHRAGDAGFSTASWNSGFAAASRNEQDELSNLRDALTQAEQQNLMLTEEFQRIVTEKDQELAKVRAAKVLPGPAMPSPAEHSQAAIGTDSASVENLRQQNAELTSTLNKLKVKAKAKILELHGNIEALQRDIAEKQCVIDELSAGPAGGTRDGAVSCVEGPVSDLENEKEFRRKIEVSRANDLARCQQLEAAASSLRAELAAAVAAAMAERQRNQELSSKLSTLEREHQDQLSRAAVSARELATLQSELSKSTAVKEDLELKLARNRSEPAEANGTSNAAPHTGRNVTDMGEQDEEATGTALPANVTELEELLATARRERDEALAASSAEFDLRRRIDELETALSDVGRHAAEVAALREQNSSLTTLRERAEQRHNSVVSELEAAQASERKLQGESAALSMTLATERSAWEQRRNQLEARTSELQAEVAERGVHGETELMELRRRNEELELDRGSLQERLAACEGEAAAQRSSLEAALGNQVERVSELESELANSATLHEAAVQKLKHDMAHLEHELLGAEQVGREARVAKEEMQTKLDATVKSLDEAEASVAEFRTKSTDLQSTVTKLQAELERVVNWEETLASLQQAKEIAEGEAATLRSEVRRLTELAQAASTLADEERTKVASMATTMETEMRRLDAEISELREHREVLIKEKEDALSALEMETKELYDATSLLQAERARLNEAEAELDRERVAHRRLQGHLQVQEEQIVELSKRIQAKEETLFVSKNEVTNVRAELYSAHTSLAAMSRELDKEKDESRKALESYASLHETYSETSKLLEQAREEAQEAMEMYHSAKSELAGVVSQLAEAREWQEAADGLRVDLESLRSESAAKSGLLDSARAALEAARDENKERSAVQQAEIERLTREAVGKEELTRTLRDEVDELKEELAELARLHATQAAEFAEKHEREMLWAREAAVADGGSLRALKAEAAQLRSAKSAAVADAERAQSRTKAAQEQLSRLQAEQKALREQFHGQLHELQSENSKHRQEVQRLKAALDAASSADSAGRNLSAPSSPSAVAARQGAQQPAQSDLLERVEFYTFETARLQSENNKLKGRLVSAERLSRNAYSREADQWSAGGGSSGTLGWLEETSGHDDDLMSPGARSSVIVVKGRNRVRRTLRNVVHAANRQSLRFARFVNSRPASRVGFQGYLLLLHAFLAYALLAKLAFSSSPASALPVAAVADAVAGSGAEPVKADLGGRA